MKLEKGLQKYENLNRKDYFDKNQELSKDLWEKENIPTVADIAEFMKTDYNEKMQKIFDFFENKDDFEKMANRVNSSYTQEESKKFIKKVQASNNSDISMAGYFYKLLNASADDFRLNENDKDCESSGINFNIDDLNENIYNYRIKSMFVNELDKFCSMNYKDFINFCKNNDINSVNVRTPLTCKHAGGRSICKKCAGLLPLKTKNIGTFSTLMITEFATQNCLSSMNAGVKKNINDIVALRYDGPYCLESIFNWIDDLCNQLENDNVQRRFYEIAFLSRIRKDEDGEFVASLKGSINYSGNLMGSYIFTPNFKNFEKMFKAGSFEDNSLKLMIAMNKFN